MEQNAQNTAKIARLNDALRQHGRGGEIFATAGFQALAGTMQQTIIHQIRMFDTWTEDNDPWGEHDFGAVEQGNVKVFWKIVYYDNDSEFHSEDPSDPTVTRRVMTIMLADEY